MANSGKESLKSAVALAYGQADAAPRVVAKGRGFLAEQIIARARESGVYVHQSRDLVALLLQVDLDQHIPPQLHLAVAELLAWLYRLENGQPAAASWASDCPLAPARSCSENVACVASTSGRHADGAGTPFAVVC